MVQANATAGARNKDKRTPLSEAASRGNLPIVKLLLESEADAENKDFEGSALEAAINGRNAAIIQLLFHSGSNVNRKGAFCSDALQAAAYNTSAEVVSKLLDKGTEVNAQRRKVRQRASSSCTKLAGKYRWIRPACLYKEAQMCRLQTRMDTHRCTER